MRRFASSSHLHQRIRGPFIRSESAIINLRLWLRSLGLGRYEKKFRENKINSDVLADLTDRDLEELGVPLGDRRRLLRAIAELAAHEPHFGPNSIGAGHSRFDAAIIR